MIKEAELIDFITTTVMEVMKEQEMDADGNVFLQDPGIAGNPSIDYQLKKTGFEFANASPEAFVQFWFNRCNRLAQSKGYGPIKSMQNTTRQAEYCFTNMPQTSKNYITGSNRRYILQLWIAEAEKIWEYIDRVLVPKMAKQYDQTNFNSSDRKYYDKYESWVNWRFKLDYEEKHGTNYKILEYIADAIGIIGLFFGPVGWAVSTAAGLVGAFARVKQGNIGGAGVILALDIIPGFKLFKHIKHVKKFKGAGDDAIEGAFKFFDEPSEAAYKALTKTQREIVEYTLKNPTIIKPLLKTTKEAVEMRNTIKNIKSMKDFWKFSTTKTGKSYGLDKLGWKEFQQYQKSLMGAEKVMVSIKNGIKTSAPFVIALVPGLYAISWAMYGANRLVFENYISDTEDLITAKKLGNKWHYKYDRVLNQRYPYNTTFTKCEDYRKIFETENILPGMPPNILLLVKSWGDKEMFPEIIPKKDSCMGMEMDTVANPGGGWRPNLCCLKDYNLTRQIGGPAWEEEIMNSIDSALQALEGEEINETEARQQIGDTLNLPSTVFTQFEFPDDISDTTANTYW